jgi:hypothetical protein
VLISKVIYYMMKIWPVQFHPPENISLHFFFKDAWIGYRLTKLSIYSMVIWLFPFPNFLNKS